MDAVEEQDLGGLQQRLADPETAQALNRLLDRASDLEKLLSRTASLEKSAPDFAAIATDTVDEACRRAGANDASSLPTSMTAAAIRKQAPIVVENLLATMAGEFRRSLRRIHLLPRRDSLILAEFDYNHQPVESFPFNQAEERFSMMMLKKHGLPNLYWHGVLKGRA